MATFLKKNYLLAPGPTPVPPEVALAGAQPMVHHRTPAFETILQETTAGLQYLFGTKSDVFTLAASGTGAMETAMANLLSPGDRAIIVTGGKFGERWAEIAKAYNISANIIQIPYGSAVKPEQIAESLAAFPDTKAVFTQLCETSTGCVYDIAAIGKVVAKTNAVLVVDAISGLLAEPCPMDAWHVDCLVTGSQKGFMLPPGLAFLAMSDKAWTLVEASKSPRYYFDLRLYKKGITSGAHPFTPAVGLITQLHAAIARLRAETIEGTWARHAWLGNACRAAVKAWGLPLFAERPCNVLTAVKPPEGIASEKLVGMIRDEFGVTIAGAQGNEMKGKLFRIAHLGYMDRFDVIIGVSAVEMALSRMGHAITLGSGVAAASAMLAKEPSL